MKSAIIRFSFLLVIFSAPIFADREVRIRLRVPASVHHLEIEWMTDKDAPPSVPEILASGEVRRKVADNIRFFRVRSVDAEGRTGAWSDLYPVDKFARNLVPAGSAVLVSGDAFQLEIKAAGTGWQVKIIKPASGITFRSGPTTTDGTTYLLGPGNSVALLFAGETVPFAVLMVVTEPGGSGLRFVTPLGVRVVMAPGIRIAVVQPGVPLK